MTTVREHLILQTALTILLHILKAQGPRLTSMQKKCRPKNEEQTNSISIMNERMQTYLRCPGWRDIYTLEEGSAAVLYS